MESVSLKIALQHHWRSKTADIIDIIDIIESDGFLKENWSN